MNQLLNLRKPPGSACEACRRVKMRCDKEPGSPCSRCRKAGRECVPPSASAPSPAAQHKRRRRGSPINQHRYSEELPPRHSDVTAAPGVSGSPVLPSIFSTSPVANHIAHSQHVTTPESRQHGNSFSQPPAPRDNAGTASNGYISNEDTMQLIEIFRERLLITIPILIPSDYLDAQHLMAKHPNLVLCISYVTARYIPGYEEVRKSLVPAILTVLQTAFTPATRDIEDELATMQAFIILYVFQRGSVLEKTSESSAVDEISFWSAKTTCEAFAMHINLHRAVGSVKKELEMGRNLNRTDTSTRKYLYWLWLYTISHHISIVTSTPPTVHADASIRIAPALLQSLRNHEDVSLVLGEVQLCLLWDKLGTKDSSLKEWWCSTDLQEAPTGEMSRVTFEDVDTALDEWRAQSQSVPISRPGKGLMSLSPDYHFHYTRFCLNTHFIRHIRSTNLQAHQSDAIGRAIDSALRVLGLSRKIGPALRDQLRYFPGFLFVSLSFCSSFVLQAIEAFPSMFPSPAAELDLVKNIAVFMKDLSVDKSHGAWVAGASLLRQVNATMEVINRRQTQADHSMREPVPALMTPANSGIQGGEQPPRGDDTAEGIMVGSGIGYRFGESAVELPDFFDFRFQGMNYAFG